MAVKRVARAGVGRAGAVRCGPIPRALPSRWGRWWIASLARTESAPAAPRHCWRKMAIPLYFLCLRGVSGRSEGAP